MVTKPELQDYVRVGITVVFLGLFVYQVVAGVEVNPVVHDNLVLILALYFGLDRLGDFAGKFVANKRHNGAIEREREEKGDVT